MPGTEVVRKQTALGGLVGIALIAFALVYRFFPGVIQLVPSPAPRLVTPTVLPPPAWVAHAPVAQGVPSPLVSPATTVPPLLNPTAGAEYGPPVLVLPPSRQVAALLKRADHALAEGHLLEPKDENALQLFQAVLAEDKRNVAARAGIDKIREVLTTQTEAALERGDEGESTRLIAVLAELPHTEGELDGLRGRLKILKQVTPLLARAATLLKGGHAIAPAGGSALDVYRQVVKIDPGNALADQGLTQIERGYLDRALAAVAEGDFSGADAILADASHIRPGSQELLDTRGRIEGIRRQRAEGVLAQASSALDAGNADLAEKLAKQAQALSSDLPALDEFNLRLKNARLYASLSPGQVFRDPFLDRSGRGPEMVVIPIGSFTMGSPESEAGHRASEDPQREVAIKVGFALASDDVTVGQFREFIKASGYETDAKRLGGSSYYDEVNGRMTDGRGITWRDDYRGKRASDDLPVLHVSWNDANTYAEWLSARTGKSYRLPSEAEFEYALRAGSSTSYWWGDGPPTKVLGNFTGDGDRSPSKRRWTKAFPNYDDKFWGVAPIKSFPPNPFGLYDIDGNVSEWVADCWHENYVRAPRDSRAWVNPGCGSHVVRGGSWGSAPDQVRSAYRIGVVGDSRSARVSFRVARDL